MMWSVFSYLYQYSILVVYNDMLLVSLNWNRMLHNVKNNFHCILWFIKNIWLSPVTLMITTLCAVTDPCPHVLSFKDFYQFFYFRIYLWIWRVTCNMCMRNKFHVCKNVFGYKIVFWGSDIKRYECIVVDLNIFLIL